jgi:hypothetical protein
MDMIRGKEKAENVKRTGKNNSKIIKIGNQA